MTRGSEVGLRLFKPGELAKLEPRRFIIGGLIAAGDAMLLHGAPKGGKTALVVAAACSVGTGAKFFSRQVKRGVVVYVLAERVREADRRLQAALDGTTDHSVRFVRARLYGDRTNVNELIEAIKAVEAETGEPCRLLIFDTVVSLLRDGGGDENSQRDVSRLTEAIDSVRSATGAAAIVVHHSKRGEHRPKGSEVLEAWAETIASVGSVHKSTDRKLEIERSNVIEPGVKARFSLKPIDLGEDLETGARSQIVIAAPSEAPDVTDDATSASGPRRLPPDAEAALVELGKLGDPAQIEDWRTATMVIYASKPTSAARRVAFHAAKKRLEAECLITIDGNTVSVSRASA